MNILYSLNSVMMYSEKAGESQLSRAFDSFRKTFGANLFANSVFSVFILILLLFGFISIIVFATIKYLEWRKHEEITKKTMDIVYDCFGLTEEEVELLEESAHNGKLKPYYKIVLYKSSFKRYLDNYMAKDLDVNVKRLERKIFRGET